MPEFNVHEEWDHRLVGSGHGDGIKYRVTVGTVNWKRNATGKKPAMAVFIQTGDKINYKMPAHILQQDLANVLRAIEELRPIFRSSGAPNTQP